MKTYVSAIKNILVTDGYPWEDNRLILNSLTKACRVANDRVYNRLPFGDKLLELILFEVQRYFNRDQYYLETMYKALFTLSYYGMLRVCELTKTESGHAVKAVDVSLVKNKQKLLFILRTSKMHGANKRLQQIKTASNQFSKIYFKNRYFCPFQLTIDYMKLRGSVSDSSEQFFIFSDGSMVSDYHA